MQMLFSVASLILEHTKGMHACNRNNEAISVANVIMERSKSFFLQPRARMLLHVADLMDTRPSWSPKTIQCGKCQGRSTEVIPQLKAQMLFNVASFTLYHAEGLQLQS